MPPFWTKLNNAPPVSIGAMLLLTDGRVLVHEEPNCGGANCAGMDFTAWYVLTPDINGSYTNGTWSQIANMPAEYAPLLFQHSGIARWQTYRGRRRVSVSRRSVRA